MKRFWAALGFLTVLPLPAAWQGNEDDLARSVCFYPVVGLLIGLSAAGIAAGLGKVFPPPVLSVLLVIWLAVVHGGLHMDGLSDTADGFFSPYGRERVLEIMKDSRIGAFGCMAICGAVALKIAALFSLPSNLQIRAAVMAPLAGRCAMVLVMVFLPPARKEGLGSFFSSHRSAWEGILAVLILGAIGWCVVGTACLIVIAALLIAAGLFGWISKRRIGGYSGDVLGAAGEIVETTTLLVLSMGPMGPLFSSGLLS